MSGIQKALSILLFTVLYFQNVYGYGYGWEYRQASETEKPVSQLQLNRFISKKHHLRKDSRPDYAKLHQIKLAEYELQKLKKAYHANKLPRYAHTRYYFNNGIDRIVAGRRSDGNATSAPRNESEIPLSVDEHSLALTLPDISPLTRSDEEALENEIQNAVDDLKQRLRSLTASPERRDINDKITLDEKFSDSLIETVLYYARKQTYAALKSWVDRQVEQMKVLTPPKLFE